MSPVRAILPALAFAVFAQGQVLAASASGCSTSGTLTVTNTAQLSSVSACSTYSGSIAIATGATAISLDGPKRIEGDLIVLPNGGLQTLEAADLQVIDGTFSLKSLSSLQSVTMPSLTSVEEIDFETTGQSFLSLGFGTPGVTQISNLTISDTYLQSLTGIYPGMADSVSISNNVLLSTVNLPLNYTTGPITVQGYSSNYLSVAMSSLTTCGALSVIQCSSFSAPALQNTTGLLSVRQNSFSNLTLSNLTSAASLTIYDNAQLTNFSLPLLNSISGALNVIQNSDLSGNITFPALTLINGAANLTGTFSGVSMPKLNRVQGTFTVESTQDIDSTCTTFDNDNQVFSRPPVCGPRTNSTSPSGSGSPTSSSGTPTSTPKSGAMSFAEPPVMYTAAGFAAALFGLLM